MTHKDAIEVIKSNYPSSGYVELREALDLAIIALSEKAIRQTIASNKDMYSTSIRMYE